MSSHHLAHALAFGAFACVLLVLRTIAVIVRARRPSGVRTHPCRTLCVLGSGGHTAEILSLLSDFDRARYAPLTFVVASMKQQITRIDEQRTIGIAQPLQLVRVGSW